MLVYTAVGRLWSLVLQDGGPWLLGLPSLLAADKTLLQPQDHPTQQMGSTHPASHCRSSPYWTSRWPMADPAGDHGCSPWPLRSHRLCVP